MAKIPFTVSARTAKLIGQENFANAEGAIIELVKNAYDADAKNALIVFNNADKNQDGHSIYIIDNGHGMTESIVRNKWMQIGTDDKLQNVKSESGRIKTGAKGIGRFALDRLGIKARMLTVSKNESLYWYVNWKNFEKVGLPINEVYARVWTLKNFSIKSYLKKTFSKYSEILDIVNKTNFNTGTVLKISLLKDAWDEKAIKSLFDNLEVLVPPIEQPEFSIHLFSTNNLNNFGQVNTAYYDDYDYKLSAEYLGDEKQTLKVKIKRNELNVEALETSYKEVFSFEQMKHFPFNLETFKAKEFELNLTLNNLKGFSAIDPKLLQKIGKFDFTFYFLKNRTSDDKGDADLKKYPYKNFLSANRIAWLEKFGGVKIFRDGFRVRPYGENGQDWLKLGERQAISPQGAGQRIGAYRIRPNQIAGTVNISRVHNAYFNDKSGREGIQENDVFEVFENLLIEIINLFEKDRNVIMFHLSELFKGRFEFETKRQRAIEEAERILREKRKKENNKGQKSTYSNQFSQEPTETEELFANATQSYEQALEEKDTEIRLLRGLASVGLIISSSAHELTSLRQRIIPRTDYLVRELKKYISKEDLVEVNEQDNPFFMLNLMREEDSKLKHWLDYSLNSLKKDRRKRTEINFGEYFEEFQKTWHRALLQRNVKLKLNGTKDAPNKIKAFAVDLDAIFNNLITNSFEALKGKPDKQISISWKKVNDFIEVAFVDNGRGLAQEYKNHPSEIFNPHETTKRDNKGNIIGTGLGLYIVKSVIEDYNDAAIDLMNCEVGFGLKLTFPLHKK